MTKNDIAWKKIFEHLNVVNKLNDSPMFQISAKQINDIGQEQARLMTKFDTKQGLPALFKQHQLNINATSNGHYIIFKDPGHQSFIDLPDYSALTPTKFQPQLDFYLDTLPFRAQMSESNAIDYAHHAGILSAQFNEPILKLTTRGRFFSDEFNFELSGAGSMRVKSVQVEVDAGYEGRKQFIILEAKSSTHSSFNVRQLYYPFRHFQTKTQKRVRTVLQSFSNGVYYFTEVAFDANQYTPRIVANTAIEVEISAISRKPTIAELLSQITHTPVNIPSPQADDINKVIDLVILLSEGALDKFQIAEYFEFDERQGDYYGNAGSYIGLIEKSGRKYQLTATGREVASTKNREARNALVLQQILRTSLFNDIIKTYYSQDKNISDGQIIERLQQEDLNATTAARRRSTVKAWVRWIAEVLDSM